MTEVSAKGNFDCQTCICCLCRCGNHECFQQLAMKLPNSMTRHLGRQSAVLKRKNEKKKYANRLVPSSDLYENTTYKRDFCGKRDFFDSFPLQQKKHVGTFKINYGYPENNSTYRDEFLPWSIEAQDLCRGKLHVPDQTLEETTTGSPEVVIPPEAISDELRNYYCPPHCVGEQREEPDKNCLVGHKETFNLGPPEARKKKDNLVNSKDPFTKLTSYMLDYKEHALPPREEYKQTKLKESPQPMTSDTSYRKDFTCPSQIDPQNAMVAKHKGPSCALTVGNGPMLQQTSSMLDYPDPDVQTYRSVKPPKKPFEPPTCSMETTTTTKSSYPRWKDLPHPKSAKTRSQEISRKSVEADDIRCLVTTYQEDYDGLNAALCPCSIVEKCGPRVLEPRYKYRGSQRNHDFFLYKKTDKDLQHKTNECPH